MRLKAEELFRKSNQIHPLRAKIALITAPCRERKEKYGWMHMKLFLPNEFQIPTKFVNFLRRAQRRLEKFSDHHLLLHYHSRVIHDVEEKEHFRTAKSRRQYVILMQSEKKITSHSPLDRVQIFL